MSRRYPRSPGARATALPRALLAGATALVIAVLATPIATAQPAEVRSFRSFGFDDATVHGVYGTLRYAFPMPIGRQPQPGARIDFVLSHSPLVLPDRSTMTVSVNGRALASAFLTAETRERGRVAVPMPVDALAGDRILVEISFLLRLSRDTCEDPRDPALWATVHGDSMLSLPTAPSAPPPDLRDLPRLIAPHTTAGEAAPLSLILPAAQNTPEVLRAAGLVALQYGRWASRANADAVVAVSQTAPAGTGAVVQVGTGPSLASRALDGPLRWEGAAFAGEDGAIPAEQGVLGWTRSSPPALVVSGATPAAVLTAAEALVQPERRDALAGDHAIVTGETPAWNTAARPWRNGAATFAQLGADRWDVAGPGLHTVRFNFERPPGWILDGGGTLELAIESAASVRAETSWVAARLDGLDLGAQPLASSDMGPRRYRFALPVERLNADVNGQPLRALALEVQLFLDLPRAGCADAPADGARASLLAESTWRLPHREYRGLDLGRFPAMFFDDRAPIAVVIPDGAGTDELAAGLTVIAALGRWSGSDDATWPRLTTASAVMEGERRSHHLIVIGGPAVNRLSAEARAKNRTLFPDEPPPLVTVDRDGRATWGTVRLDHSPWGRGRLLLSVDGSDASGVALAAGALARADTLGQIRGRAVALAPGLPPQSLVGAEPPERPPRDLAPRLDVSFRDRVAPWQVAGALLLGGFAATFTAVLALRRRRT